MSCAIEALATYGEIELRVEYEYEPAEPPIYEAYGGGHPGSPAQAFIIRAWHPADAAQNDLLPILRPDAVRDMENDLARILEAA